MASQKRNTWRKRLLILGFFFFIVAIVVSAFFMFVGKNTVSGDNISLSVSGPISIGGGEELSFQVAVGNQNTIPIEAVSLIIEYPDGTHSSEDITKELSVVRQSLNTINPEELVNVPVKVRVFGEENQEKQISVSIDYRIEGSGATLRKEASPLTFKISTSPIVLSFDTVKSIASGQEMELALTVQSNSPAPLSDILVKVVYPDGFDITNTKPDTISGEDTWKFASLKPGEKKVITVTGLVTGYEDELRAFEATAGVGGKSDQNVLVSLLAKTETEVQIEKSFFDVDVRVNGETSDTVVVSPKDQVVVEIRHTNVLDGAIYDGEVLVELSGNALDEFGIEAPDGFYDSVSDTVRFDGGTTEALREILPGETNTLRFTIKPDTSVGSAPQIKLKVTVKGARVLDERAGEELVGVAERTIKVESLHELFASARYESGPFTNTGPVPPVAEEVTQYTLTLRVETGANAVTGAEVVATLPSYVKWLDLVTDGDIVNYNASTRSLRWVIGDMNANASKEVSIQVSLLPSISQVGSIPTLLEVQRFKATDRFTGTVVRSEHPALTTAISEEGSSGDGKVRLR